MNSILKAHKGWFIFAYIVGMLYFVFYLWVADEGDAEFANTMLLIFAHIFLYGACDYSASATRRKLLRREFAIFVPIFSIFIFFTPKVMGLIGAYAIFVLLGYFHTTAIKEKEVFGHLEIAKTKEEATSFSDEQLKYVLWLVLSLVPLFTLYWNV